MGKLLEFPLNNEEKEYMERERERFLEMVTEDYLMVSDVFNDERLPTEEEKEEIRKEIREEMKNGKIFDWLEDFK